MHLGDEEIQRLLHGEIVGGVPSEVLHHLETCAACRELIEDARREEKEIYALLSHVDHPTPEILPRSLMVRDSARSSGTWWRKAAIIALAVGGAGVAYAYPGSPLPGWIRNLGAVISRRTTPPAVPAVSAPEPIPSGGIAVTPQGRFTIGFSSVQSRGVAVIVLTGGPDIVARSANGSATFMTDVNRLTISNDGSTADYQIQIPPGATWVEVRVANRRVLLKRGNEVQTHVEPDSLGRYVFPLTPAER
jgi:hypothetical protein